MRKFIAITATVIIHAGLVFVFARSAEEAMPLPKGEVTITELGSDFVPALAQTQHEASRVAL